MKTTWPSDPTVFTKPRERNLKNVRVAWCPDLGGLPLHPEVRDVLDKQRPTFERLGCIVEEAHPDLSDVSVLDHHHGLPGDLSPCGFHS